MFFLTLRRLYVLIFHLLLLTSCTFYFPPLQAFHKNNEPAASQTNIDKAASEHQLLSLKFPTPTIPPSITPSPNPTKSPAFTIPIPTNTWTVTPLPPFQLCSPLVDHPLEVLPKIISDPYRPPAPGKDFRHHGVDFSHYKFGDFDTIQGMGIQTIFYGKVAAALEKTFPFGNMIIIETPYNYLPVTLAKSLKINPGESLYSLYAHMEDKPAIKIGDDIEACFPIGKVGRSGNAGIFHLHLETRAGKPGAKFPEMGYYLEENTPAEKRYYLLWRTSGEFRHFDPMLVLDPIWLNYKGN